MTPAELKTRREALGLPVAWLAAQAGVAQRTVRYWESGRQRPPADVVELIEGIEARSQRMVDEALALVADMKAEHGTTEDVYLVRYREDADLWAARPDTPPLPATWHASVLARVARELEGRGISAIIEYAD